MPYRSAFLVFSLFLLPSLSASADQQDEAVGSRGPFIMTRPKTPGTKPSKQNGIKKDTWRVPNRIGLGLTVFQEIDGRAVRVSPSKEFRSKDRIRLLIEANVSGYLYVFHAENGQNPVMIFPHFRLQRYNAIYAHVPCEVPSRREPPPNNWFEFNETAATERLYFIVSREPLSGVPIGRSLVAQCKSNPATCEWHPPREGWQAIMGSVDVSSLLAERSRGMEIGKAETTDETEAVSRGFGLPKGAPAPSIIKMNHAVSASRMVAIVDLEHR